LRSVGFFDLNAIANLCKFMIHPNDLKEKIEKYFKKIFYNIFFNFYLY